MWGRNSHQNVYPWPTLKFEKEPQASTLDSFTNNINVLHTNILQNTYVKKDLMSILATK